MTFAVPGLTVRVKFDAGTIERVALEVTLWVPTVTDTGPVAAPAGITKPIAIALKVATGAAMVPPPCCLRVTVGGRPFAPAKLLPVTLITVPTEAELGLKPVMTGGGTVAAV